MTVRTMFAAASIGAAILSTPASASTPAEPFGAVATPHPSTARMLSIQSDGVIIRDHRGALIRDHRGAKGANRVPPPPRKGAHCNSTRYSNCPK